MNIKNPLTEKRKEVMSINLTDYGFIDEHVEKDTPGILFCKKHDGYTPLVFKAGPGFKGKLMRWLSVEGLPLVHSVKASSKKAQVSVTQYLKVVWGSNAFDGLPDILKEQLTRRVDVTVTVEPIIPDADTKVALKKLKADGMLFDADLEKLNNYGKGTVKKKFTDQIFDKFPWVMAGFGFNYILIALGVLK